MPGLRRVSLWGREWDTLENGPCSGGGCRQNIAVQPRVIDDDGLSCTDSDNSKSAVVGLSLGLKISYPLHCVRSLTRLVVWCPLQI